jgi:hypothetical protein
VVVEAVYAWMLDVPVIVIRAESIASGVWAAASAPPMQMVTAIAEPRRAWTPSLVLM